jgi:probable addiction module antidote protein
MAKQPQPAGKPEEIAKRLSKALERDPAAFTAALMKLVHARGMTLVARKTGVSRHTLYRYEWGEDRPLLETAMKMTAACGFKFTIVPSDELNAPSNSK